MRCKIPAESGHSTPKQARTERNALFYDESVIALSFWLSEQREIDFLNMKSN